MQSLRPHAFRSAPATRMSFIVLAGALIAILASGLAPGDLQAQSVQLRHQFIDGMDLRYELIQSTSTALPGGMGSMDQGQNQVMRLQVVSVDPEGNARVRSTVESIRIEMESPMGNQHFDSADGTETSDPALRPLAALVGVPTEMVMGPDGRVRDPGDMTAMMDAMLEDFSTEERAVMEEAFTEESLANLVSQSYQVLPDDAVSPGESWDNRISLPVAFGTLASEFVYTLESVETRDGSQVALIRVAGSMGELEIDSANPMASMINFGGGEISGTAEFDITRGIALASLISTTLQMEVMGENMTSVSEVETRLLP